MTDCVFTAEMKKGRAFLLFDSYAHKEVIQFILKWDIASELGEMMVVRF